MFNKKIKKFNQIIEEGINSGEFHKTEDNNKEIDGLIEMSDKIQRTIAESYEATQGFNQKLKNELWQKMRASTGNKESIGAKKLFQSNPWRRYALTTSLVLIFIALGLGFLVLGQRQKSSQKMSVAEVAKKIVATTKQLTETTLNKSVQSQIVQAGLFANWQEENILIQPNVKPYTVKAELNNVVNKNQFYLSESAKKFLLQNSFVVQQGLFKEFFSLYEENRYQKIPSFITTDSVLHNYHLYFNYLLKNLEEEKLLPILNDLTDLMLSESQAQYDHLRGSGWENAAKRNVAYFALAKKFLEPNYPLPDFVRPEVERDAVLIAEHNKIDISPIMTIGLANVNQETALKEDYSQYIPRGHYTNSDNLGKYFRAMTWYGRITFRLKSEEETKSAVLITKIFSANETANSLWEKIYEPTNFFVGRSDDLNFYHYRSVLEAVYQGNYDLENLINNHDGLAAFMKTARELASPTINSMPIFNSNINPDREAEIKGFRLMGQRYTIDSNIHQQLVCRNVGNKDGTMDCPKSDSRMLPKGLDVPAAFGSERAGAILRGEGDYDYKNYPENMQKLQDYFSGLADNIWRQNLYWGWLSVLKTLSPEARAGYPSFMTNQAWLDKSLNTFLGSWTELRHDTILYVKQVYAELGGGAPEGGDDRGYVEPNPQLYVKLAALTKMTKDGLDNRGLLNDKNKENLSRLEELILSLKRISEKELNSEKLSDGEYELIKGYGGSLEHFWLESFSDQEKEQYGEALLLNNPAALVADVATDPNGQVLEEAIGNIYNIYVVFPLDDQLKIGRGGIFSHYEFAWPLSDRLTDEAWWARLEKQENMPSLPVWTNSFIAGQ